MMYKICPDCGAHLDPGESCDCHKERAALLAQTRPKVNKATSIVASDSAGVNTTSIERSKK